MLQNSSLHIREHDLVNQEYSVGWKWIKIKPADFILLSMGPNRELTRWASPRYQAMNFATTYGYTEHFVNQIWVLSFDFFKKQHTKVCSLAGGLYGVHCDFGVTRSNWKCSLNSEGGRTKYYCSGETSSLWCRMLSASWVSSSHTCCSLIPWVLPVTCRRQRVNTPCHGHIRVLGYMPLESKELHYRICWSTHLPRFFPFWLWRGQRSPRFFFFLKVRMRSPIK